MVVLALHWTVAESAVKALGNLKGKIVIDSMNLLVMKDGVLGLERGFTTSGGEAVASWLPGSMVVKTFNQVGAEMMMAGDRFLTPPLSCSLQARRRQYRQGYRRSACERAWL